MQSSNLLFAILIVLVLIRGYLMAHNRLEMAFDACECNSTAPPGYLHHQSCGISKNSKRRTFIFEAQFQRDVKQFFLNMLFVLPRKDGDDFVIFNLTNINGCQMLSNRNQIVFVKMGITTLDRFSNMPTKCPFVKDQKYYIKNFRLDMNTLPALSFETEMHFWFDFVVDQKPLYSCFLKMHTYVKRGSKGAQS